jgi:hypothetical protein
MIKKLLVLLAVVGLAGCTPPHFKEMDSYGSLFRHGEAEPTGKGDPYTFGGIGEGSGGLMPRQTYADDSKTADFRDATETGKLGQIDKERTPTPDVRQGGQEYEGLGWNPPPDLTGDAAQGRRQSFQRGTPVQVIRGK